MALRPSQRGSTEYLQCDLRVEDSTFKVVSIEMDQDGELWVWLPWNLDLANLGGHIYAVNWDTFGANGLD